MDEKYTSEDLRNPEKTQYLVEIIRIKAFGSIEEMANLMMADRNRCADRGYHRVSREPKDGKDLMICYDCELWFDKDFAESCDIKYRVEPLD